MHTQATVFVVGAGRIGQALLRAWKPAPTVQLLGAWTRSAESARRTGERLELPVAHGSDWPDSIRQASVVLLTVPDDQIRSTARSLADRGLLSATSTLIHCAGALTANILANLAGTRASVASLHPLQTVADTVSSNNDLSGCFAMVEGDADAVRCASSLARAAGLEPLPLASGSKALYHAAAVLACNDLVALVALSQRLLGQAGVPEDKTLAVLTPLLRQTLENVLTRGPAAALTGPVARGDVASIEQHLQALRNDDRARAAYCALGAELLQLRASGPDAPSPEVREQLVELFGLDREEQS